MQIAVIQVENTSARVEAWSRIPAGLSGAQIRVNYVGSLWEGLTKTIIFRGTVTKDVVTESDIVNVPPEVLANPGFLDVGFYGVDNENNLAIPTFWEMVGFIDAAADPSGDETTDPSLPVWAQLADRISDLEKRGPGGNVDLTGYATEKWVEEGFQPKGNYLTEHQSLEGYAKTSEIPKKPEDIGAQPAGNYALKTEIPSVPVQSVNGKTGAVNLSADDVGARPSTWMPTAQEVGALPSTYTPPNQTAEQVGADPKGTAAGKVSEHNTNTDAHNDIRLELKAIKDRLNAFFDSDNQTLDELSEIVAYITNNKTLIDNITTSKVNVADIINNLTTNVSNKPLSAAQGVVLKGLIDTVSNSLSGYQPKGDYALKSEIPEISGKLDASALPTAINTALAQAKASGEFDGEDGVSPTVAVSKSGEVTTVIIVDKNGAKTATINDGVDGSNGKTPVRGVDYYTDADKAEFSEYIASELAKRGQLKPEFASSEEWLKANGDKTKLYVLPDGYIWGYVMTETTEEGIAYKNKLLEAVDADGNPYNGGQGWKTNTRLSSSGAESTSSATGMEVTGFIPFKRGDVIRFSGITMNGNSANKDRCYFIQYGSDKAILKQWVVSAFKTSIESGHVLTDSNGNILQINTGDMASETTSGATTPIYTNAAYFRISADEINVDSIITINQEIKATTVPVVKESWTNTGHAFVPADYEDRIIAVEEATAENETRIAKLENRTVEGVPDYVVAEAESVIDRVVSAQGNRTFTLASITDMHYGNASYTDGLVHACQAMRYIDSRIKLDAVSVLGDYTDGFTGTSYDNAIGDFKAINAELNALRFAPNLRMHGNHDHYEPHSPILHRYITAYSDDVVWGSKLGGYFYRDFEDFKLRVICLNTAEENDDGLSCSAEQYNWFANTLNLSSKENYAEWQTLILSHHPLDWFISNNSGYVFWQILNAYLTGTSWSGINFAGKNSARIVSNIHGHIHNLLTRKIAAGQPNTTENTVNVVRVATPEACYGRPNGYNGLWDYNPFGEDTSYPKTQGTAEDTAFCIYCVDLDSHTIKAICYGSGYDREISY